MESIGRTPWPVDPAVVVAAVVVQSVATVTGSNSLTLPGQDGGSVPEEGGEGEERDERVGGGGREGRWGGKQKEVNIAGCYRTHRGGWWCVPVEGQRLAPQTEEQEGQTMEPR